LEVIRTKEQSDKRELEFKQMIKQYQSQVQDLQYVVQQKDLEVSKMQGVVLRTDSQNKDPNSSR